MVCFSLILIQFHAHLILEEMIKRPRIPSEEVQGKHPQPERDVVQALHRGHLTQNHPRVPHGVAERPAHHLGGVVAAGTAAAASVHARGRGVIRRRRRRGQGGLAAVGSAAAVGARPVGGGGDSAGRAVDAGGQLLEGAERGCWNQE